jgi:hypothetical protein
MSTLVPSQIARRMMSHVCLWSVALVLSHCSKPTVVEWPALKEMDEWAEKGEAWADGAKIGEIRKELPGFIAAAEKLAASPVPANVADAKGVAQVMGDFRDVLTRLKKPGISDDDLKTLVAALHPLVERLMEVAGMPHVHEHDDHDEKEKK